MNLNDINFNTLIKRLDNNYAKENIDGITCYYHTDKKTNKVTSRIVALKTSDNCVGICVNTYKNENGMERKAPFTLFNKFNPSFIIFGNSDDKFELQRGINALVDILKVTGDISVISFGDKKLNIAQLEYSSEYKVKSNPMYNRRDQRLNIKAIGDIIKDINKASIRFEKMGVTYKQNFEEVYVTGSHKDFKIATYNNVLETTKYEEKAKVLEKKTK